MNRVLFSLSILSATSFSLLSPYVLVSLASGDGTRPPPIVTAEPPPFVPSPDDQSAAGAPSTTPAPSTATPPLNATTKTPESAPAPAAPSAITESVPPSTSEADSIPAPATPEQSPVQTTAHEDNSNEVAPVPAARSSHVLGPRDDTKFQLLRPSWGVHVDYSTNALGKSDISVGQGISAKGLSIAGEYEPKFLQILGVFSAGPILTVYPVIPSNALVTTGNLQIWSAGIQLHYQARFFREQLLVPMVGYDYEKLTYHVIAASGGFPVSGPVAGLYLLMNPLESSSAFDFYNDAGILRTYLTAEIRSLKGSDANISVAGTSSFFGIRVEF